MDHVHTSEKDRALEVSVLMPRAALHSSCSMKKIPPENSPTQTKRESVIIQISYIIFYIFDTIIT